MATQLYGNTSREEMFVDENVYVAIFLPSLYKWRNKNKNYLQKDPSLWIIDYLINLH